MFKLRDKKTGKYLNKRHGWNELTTTGKLYHRRPSTKNRVWGQEVEWEVVEFNLVEVKPRPYEPTGMTTAKWMKLREERVDVSKVVFSQDHLSLSHLLHPADSYSGDPCPHLVEWEGKLWVSDGHHRIIRAILSGYTYLFCRVLKQNGETK